MSWTGSPPPQGDRSSKASAEARGSLVSVIVPIFDVEEYLERCVDSLINQSYSHLELILVDDGSPDRCGALCDEYAVRDSRVRVIHQANAGVSAARNAGLDAAAGDLVMFVDGDDWVEADMVRHLVDALHEHGADIAAGRLRLSGSDNEPGPDTGSGRVRLLSSDEALDLYAGPLSSTMTSPCCKIYRRPLFEGIRFPVGHVYEDVFVTHQVIGRAQRVALSSAELYHYCVRAGSATQRSQGVAQLQDRAQARRQRGDYLLARGLGDGAAASYWAAFLDARLAAGMERARGAHGPARQLTRNARVLARQVVVADLPLRYRVLAGAYALAPRSVDRAMGNREQAAAQRGRARRTPRQTDRASGHPARAGQDAAATMDQQTRHLEVIVVAYGSPALLRQTLEPVASLSVTVVDNSSMAEIEELCRDLGVRYLDGGGNRGFAAGVNIGLANKLWPQSDVLLLNPDAVISAEGVQRLHEALLAVPDLASVGPAQVDGQGRAWRVSWPFHSPWATWAEALGLERLRRNAPSFVVGSVLLIRSEALATVGHFDERFFLYFEETDWALRAHRRGWRHAVVPEVEALHLGGATSSDVAGRNVHFHRSQEAYFKKHYGPVAWQIARWGQILGDTAWATVEGGPPARLRRERARILLRGTDTVAAERGFPSDPPPPTGIAFGGGNNR